MSYPNWPEPICHHYVADGASHCAAWIAYESVVWPLLGYLDNLPCFDEGLPCPKRLLETREERSYEQDKEKPCKSSTSI